MSPTGSSVQVMVMLVSWRIDRILVALLAVAALGGADRRSLRPAADPKRPPAQKPAKPAQKPQAGRQAVGQGGQGRGGRPSRGAAAVADRHPHAGAACLHDRSADLDGAAVQGRRQADGAVIDGEDDDGLPAVRGPDLGQAEARHALPGQRAGLRHHPRHAFLDHVPRADRQPDGRRADARASSSTSGNDASVAVAEGMAGSEEAFAERMNKKAKELGLTGSVFKNSSGWPAEGQMVTARDLALLAWHTINDFPEFYKLLRAADLHLQRQDPAQPQSRAQAPAGRRRPQDRPHRGGRLRPDDVGDARRAAPDPGAQRPRLDGRARVGDDAADRMGLPRLHQHDDLQAPATPWPRRRCGSARRTRCRWSCRARSR